MSGLPAGRLFLVGMLVFVVFGFLLGLRAVQGQPPASTWAELLEAPSPSQSPSVVGPADQLRVVAEGETFWSIALEIAPNDDPRVVTARLIEANGHVDTSALQIGQQLVIPASLIGPDQAGSALSTP